VPLRLLGLVCAACATAVVVALEPNAHAGSDLDLLLRSRLGLTPSQVAAVREGRPVAVALPSSVDREIQVGGAVHVGAPADRLTALLQDVERLETGHGFLQTKRLSDPPRLADFKDLQLPADDIAALRKCRPGDCSVKLGKGAFDLLARIDWTASDVTAKVNDLTRATALTYIDAYRKGGNAELAIYLDSKRPQFIATEFAGLMARAQVWPEVLRPLYEYLLTYPATSAPTNSTGFFYWSMAEFGLKPVLRLNHVVVFPTGHPAGPYSVVAVKQLYASHYFQTALEIRAVVSDEGQSASGSTLVIVNMARSDGLTGLFGGLVKSKARSGSREGLERALAAIRRMAESPALDSGPQQSALGSRPPEPPGSTPGAGQRPESGAQSRFIESPRAR
jgi:hypothetical protein